VITAGGGVGGVVVTTGGGDEVTTTGGCGGVMITISAVALALAEASGEEKLTPLFPLHHMAQATTPAVTAPIAATHFHPLPPSGL